MRSELNKIDMDGKIVIGEGEMDEAPMLFIGENVGTKKGQLIDIAVDPLEGPNFVAKNLPNSFAVLAAAEKGNLFFAPDTYMEKIVIGPNLPNDLVDLDFSVEKNISRLAEAKNISPEKLTVCILDRPRHEKIISILTVNGIRFSFKDGSWGLIRASSNKPSLVIVVESPTSDERKKKIFDYIDAMLKNTKKIGEYDQKI